MGVPALFRWLSKKYPKITLPVVEEEERTLPSADGEEVTVPIDITTPNPNGEEFDNLYLDMNGIVHPCTHPEGKPAPETEEEMMVEVFKYTERVVNMIRPRKLLMMAIDGVAPRAKMNQQRSRRFRASQEAKEKEESMKESLLLWESMGKTAEDLPKNKAWDSNAITPGTPFMDLLAQSLRYWVVQKMNTDPGWKQLEVIISDASVPGEGEHKIMDFIRRQRSNPGHDPNIHHVIYGLDADLIMLSLATHEPYFRVLREDVFFQDISPSACRICKQEGHYAAQCTGTAKIKADEHDVKKAPPTKKPFVFLDVSILREYLEIELNVTVPFSFDFERAIDDWVLLIFFVGNDFLPHLPSLEIREGAIDSLLSIWKAELPRMGGYMTNHGNLELARAEIILEGLARLEGDIFRRRREAEERQDRNAKRRKLEAEQGIAMAEVKPSASLQLTGSPAPPIVHGLPPRPNFDSFENAANSLGFAAPPTADIKATAMAAFSGTASDWVNSRREIRMANLSAAETLKAEMMSAIPANPEARRKHFAQMKAAKVQVDVAGNANAVTATEPALTQTESPDHSVNSPAVGNSPIVANPPAVDSSRMVNSPPAIDYSPTPDNPPTTNDPPTTTEQPTANEQPTTTEQPTANEQPTTTEQPTANEQPTADEQPTANERPTADEQLATVWPTHDASQLEEPTPCTADVTLDGESSPHGVKRKADEVDGPDGADSEAFDLGTEEDEEDATGDAGTSLKRIVNPDGSVEQEDNVRLFEPGYKERYYLQKFGVWYNDYDFRKRITTSYIEGMAWVLQYYYQGTPSWTWYYPYHFAPFAQDFAEVSKMDIKFEKGQPFRPFEQLMGVFPAASRQHIPEVFRSLMTDEDSPIIDFYPTTFEIDMNGKKMAWQGVALLPFIDETRLLEAMSTKYDMLTEEEIRRNTWGSNVLYVADEHPLYPVMESLYAKRKGDKNTPIPIDPIQSKGLNGSLLPDPSCVPGSTYESPLTRQGLPDISGDRSLTALYFFPKQLRPHTSALLPGIRLPHRALSSSDYETIKSGRRGRPREAGFHAINSGRDVGRGSPRSSYGNGGQPYHGGYNGDGRDSNHGGRYGGYGNGSSHYSDRGQPPPSRGRADYGRPNYGAPPPRSYYQPSPLGGDYSRPTNSNSSYYQSGSSSANSYSRPPPYASSSFVPPQNGRYSSGGDRGAYSGYGQASSHSQSYSSRGSGYGGNSRGGGNYGGYGGNTGGGRDGAPYGYGSDTSSSYGGYGGYGGGRGGGGGNHYGNQPSHGGSYGRGGAPPVSSYNGRGRGYSRY